MTAPPKHRLGGCLSIFPGVVFVLYALLADVMAGRNLINDWGTGQTVFLILGVLLAVFGWTIHRKAVKDEHAGRRRYNRTITFIATQLVLFFLGPLILGEIAARISYQPPAHGSSYHVRDPKFGIVLAPNKKYQVSSLAKDFDIHVAVDDKGYRFHNAPIVIDHADVFVVGDSHPFGWGVDESMTLPAQLSKKLESAGHPSNVVNGGVPGYGPVQSLLRIEALVGKLRPGATVILFINPVNDMVNLSMDVDYRYPKPHAILSDDELTIEPPPTDADGYPYRFSPAFAELNKIFNQSVPAKWLDSALYRWIAGTDVPPENEVKDGVVIMKDETTSEKYLADDRQRILDRPAHYAARFWTEMPELTRQREILQKIARALFARLKESSTKNDWKLIVVLAPEALHYQAYSKDFIDQVDNVWTSATIKPGWTQSMLTGICNELGLRSVSWNDVKVEPEVSYIQNDDHTSAIGHGHIADAIVKQLLENKNEL